MSTHKLSAYSFDDRCSHLCQLCVLFKVSWGRGGKIEGFGVRAHGQ